jgi:ComF family protein
LQPAVTGSESTENVELCSDCYDGLPHNVYKCSHCALPLPDDIDADVLCGRCIKKRPSFDYSYSLFRYEGEIIKLVHQLKFREKISYTRSIGELLLHTVADELLPAHGWPDAIVPVPLHNSRLRKRGYNQSTEISRVIAKETGIAIEQKIVIRHRRTLTQTGLKANQRQKNIRGAFKLLGKLNAKHVLIVDDVITTGSTVNELSRVLKQSGVDRVGVLSIARAPLKG